MAAALHCQSETAEVVKASKKDMAWPPVKTIKLLQHQLLILEKVREEVEAVEA